jgi:predicted CXXCH cytochrome family protein
VFEDPVRGTKFFYHFGNDGLSVTVPSVFGDDHFPLTYAIGSGTHGMTFLSLIPHDEGQTIGVEHRATFFRSKEALGITPGQRGLPPPTQEVEHFGKIVAGRTLDKCVQCHTTSGRIVREQIVGLEAHVGCERCHGPGHEHVQALEENREDHRMRVEDRWPAAHDEIRTCGQCHRLPNMLKETELKRESVALVRLQPVGLLQSACYRKSEGRLRCTTCHNPHKSASKNSKHYERICLDCHSQPNSTNCPINAQTNCLECHMPGIVLSSSIFHDHWIRVRNDADPAPARLESMPPTKK